MSQPERFEILVLGSGFGGKLLAWHMARSGRRTAVVERRWIGGSCPNIACLPSKNEIWSARVAYLARHAARFGTVTGAVKTDMATVRQRKRDMVDREIALHLQNYKTSGAELIMGAGRFVAPKTLEVRLNDGGPSRARATASSSTSEAKICSLIFRFAAAISSRKSIARE
jgi:pyruvate/2-oxoglutarate dehydrogenase complex dihydrolipoamide dehydrogenase (E3) component